MAITQQILRISSDTLEKARGDAAVLDDLISFRPTADVDSLDLDWAPAGLIRLAASTLTIDEQSAHSRAVQGSAILDPAHPDGPQRYDVYSDITFLSPLEVRNASDSLQKVDVDFLVGAVPKAKEEQMLFFGKAEAFLTDDPKRYYREKFLALRDFLHGAASQGMALVMWWD